MDIGFARFMIEPHGLAQTTLAAIIWLLLSAIIPFLIMRYEVSGTPPEVRARPDFRYSKRFFWCLKYVTAAVLVAALYAALPYISPGLSALLTVK